MDIDSILFWIEAAEPLAIVLGVSACGFVFYSMVVNWMNKVEAILEEIKEKLDKDDE